MAVFNEILVGRYNRALQKLLSMKGEAPVPQVASEVMPVLPFFWGAELRYLEGWERFASGLLQAALAAQPSILRLRNPTAANVVAVIEKLTLGMTVADNPIIGLGGGVVADLAAVATPGRLDARGRPKPSLIFSGGNQASVVTNVFVLPIQANIALDFIVTDIQELTLLPGDTLEVSTQVVNTSLRAGLIWRERFLEESERA